MLVLQSQWPLQQALTLDQGWQGQVMGQGSGRHLLAVNALAPAMVQPGALTAPPHPARPDWVR